MAKAKKTKPKADTDETQEVDPKGNLGEQAGASKGDQVAEVAPEDLAAADSGELLQRLWSAQVKVLLDIVENTPPNEIQAATLATIQRFLGDNDIRAETVERRKVELERLKQQAVDFRKTPFGTGDDGFDDYRRGREGR